MASGRPFRLNNVAMLHHLFKGACRSPKRKTKRYETSHKTVNHSHVSSLVCIFERIKMYRVPYAEVNFNLQFIDQLLE